jgi:hypothetical protein
VLAKLKRFCPRQWLGAAFDRGQDGAPTFWLGLGAPLAVVSIRINCDLYEYDEKILLLRVGKQKNSPCSLDGMQA